MLLHMTLEYYLVTFLTEALTMHNSGLIPVIYLSTLFSVYINSTSQSSWQLGQTANLFYTYYIQYLL